MAERTPKYSTRYEELMRGAGERRRALSARLLANERRFRAERRRISQQPTDRVQRDLEVNSEVLRIARLIERELVALKLKLEGEIGSDERILLKAEIAHLYALKSNLIGKPNRKPPEAGLPVPAAPPRGPLPKQGGAAAALDFDG